MVIFIKFLNSNAALLAGLGEVVAPGECRAATGFLCRDLSSPTSRPRVLIFNNHSYHDSIFQGQLFCLFRGGFKVISGTVGLKYGPLFVSG